MEAGTLLTNPEVVYAGVEDAALFRSSDGGQTWQEFEGLRQAKGHLWSPGTVEIYLHTIIQDPANPGRIYTAISAAGAFRTDDGGQTWKPVNHGLQSNYELPDPNAEVGHCVHSITMHPPRPNVLFMQKHWDVMRSDDAGKSWHEVSGNLPSDLGLLLQYTPKSRKLSTSSPSRATGALPAGGNAAAFTAAGRAGMIGNL